MYSGQTSSISRSGNSWVQLGNGGFKQRPSIINFYQPSDAVLRRKNLQKQVNSVHRYHCGSGSLTIIIVFTALT